MTDYITVRSLLEANQDRLKLKLFTWDRIQILGNTEISYLQGLSDEELVKSIDRFIEFEMPLIVVTNNNKIPQYLIQSASRRYISIIQSPFNTTQFVHLLGDYLENTFAPMVSLHGSMVDVYGIGILFTGRSGIGKSEIALDLVERGHRLVADDLVIIKRLAEEILVASGKDLSEHMMEIRGVGLVNIKQIFGIRGVRQQKRVEVVVNLVEWQKNKSYERVGIQDSYTEILGVKIPEITLPINPGKNVTVIAETIAMNQLSKTYGYHPAKEFNARLLKKMENKGKSPFAKDRSYFEKDFE